MKLAPCFLLPFLSPGTSEAKAPKETHSSKPELDQAQAAARLSPTSCRSSKSEMAWYVICN